MSIENIEITKEQRAQEIIAFADSLGAKIPGTFYAFFPDIEEAIKENPMDDFPIEEWRRFPRNTGTLLRDKLGQIPQAERGEYRSTELSRKLVGALRFALNATSFKNVGNKFTAYALAQEARRQLLFSNDPEACDLLYSTAQEVISLPPNFKPKK